MKKILVTGGAGYIGSHTCKALNVAGYEPITYDNLSTGHQNFVKWGPFIQGDLQDTEKLAMTLLKYLPIGVIHFAACAYVGESVSNPLKYYRNNVGGTLSLLEAMNRSNVKNIVFSSTCSTYGSPNVNLIEEGCQQNPINPYGQSKLMIEKILGDLSSKKQINHISLRYFNAAGADKDGEIGESHYPETHLIPLAILYALGNEALKIFGSDFSTPDGTAIRDYIHVEDLAEDHILSLEYLIREGKSEYINLGTGNGVSVKQIVSTLREMGINVNAIDAERRAGDPPILIANALKAANLLNWKPKYNSIYKILETAVSWHAKNLKNTGS